MLSNMIESISIQYSYKIIGSLFNSHDYISFTNELRFLMNKIKKFHNSGSYIRFYFTIINYLITIKL